MISSSHNLSYPLVKSSTDVNMQKLFVGGLPPDSKAEDIKSILSTRTQIYEVVLKRRPKNDKCIGHGYIVTSKKGAEDLLRLQSFKYRKRKVKIAPYQDGNKLEQFRKEVSRRRVFIKNLPNDIKADQISEYFKEYGEIESCYMRGEPKSNLKIAVLIFKQKISALKVYEDYRFGELDFEEILKRKMEKNVYVGFRFFIVRASPNMENNQKGLESSEEMSRGVLSQEAMELLLKKPGQIGFDYVTDNPRGTFFSYNSSLRRSKYHLVRHPIKADHAASANLDCLDHT